MTLAPTSVGCRERKQRYAVRAKRVSLASEVDAIASAVDGVRILLSQLATGHLADEWSERHCAATAEAMLTLVRSRLGQVHLAITDNLDPAQLSGPHNEATHDSGQDDVVLEGWNAMRLRAELRRLDRRVRRESPVR